MMSNESPAGSLRGARSSFGSLARLKPCSERILRPRNPALKRGVTSGLNKVHRSTLTGTPPPAWRAQACLYGGWPPAPVSQAALRALSLACVMLTACNNGNTYRPTDPAPLPDRLANFSHLNHLSEIIGEDEPVRIVHIYSEAPDYHRVGDDDEGIACVDDAARAAVVYLRDFELNGMSEHRQAAEELLRFILAMQSESGLFYNFVLDNQLTINKTHRTSTAESFEWWAARAVWALGVGARTLKTANPDLSTDARDAVERTYPHLENLLERYRETVEVNGRSVPQWLIHETASDATSELLLGLHALNQAYPDPRLDGFIERFSDGIAQMQWGGMAQFPWSAHASWIDSWHGWGNSQTQALSEIGKLQTAIAEAEHFYPRLLVLGWIQSFNLDDQNSVREFAQIAYATRGVAVGLVRLYEATGDERYAVMAGLAASWFTGNNVAGIPMYDAETGRGYDGINSRDHVNQNAGAESTIEALLTIVEIERHPLTRRWAEAAGDTPGELKRDDKVYLYRVFTTGPETFESRVALVMNLSDEKLDLLFDPELEQFLTGQN